MVECVTKRNAWKTQLSTLLYRSILCYFPLSTPPISNKQHNTTLHSLVIQDAAHSHPHIGLQSVQQSIPLSSVQTLQNLHNLHLRLVIRDFILIVSIIKRRQQQQQQQQPKPRRSLTTGATTSGA